jgi:hypothetical protein
MKFHTFPITVVSLLTAFSFGAIQAPRLKLSTFALAPQDTVQEQVPESCPVTKPPIHPFVPPSPYPTTHTNGFWFGTDKLWTYLPKNGIWRLSHYSPTDTTLSQKLPWWREGYDPHNDPPPEYRPMLKITGKRLNSPALSFASDNADNVIGRPPYIMTGLDIPSVGCWKITARFEDAELSFIIWITD